MNYKLSMKACLKAVVRDYTVYCIYGQEIITYDTITQEWEAEEKDLCIPVDKDAFVSLMRVQHFNNG